MDKYTAQEKAFQKKLFISGTNIPKNKANIKDKESLKDFEEMHFSIKSLNPPEGDFSSNHLKKIHKHLLEDVYDWAGEYRNFPTARGESAFCRPEFIKQETDKITKAIDISELKKLREKEFVKKLAHTIGELNAIHPFLDGNGRAIRIYAQQIAKAAEYELNIEKIREKPWNQASIESFHGNNKPLERIISRNLTRTKDLGVGR